MKSKALALTACGIMVLASAALPGLTQEQAADRDRQSTPRRHFGGLIDDYTPSAAVVAGGPYEMRGKWSLTLDEQRGTGTFSAVMNMETSDYGIVQGTVNKDDPTTRGELRKLAFRNISSIKFGCTCPHNRIQSCDLTR